MLLDWFMQNRCRDSSSELISSKDFKAWVLDWRRNGLAGLFFKRRVGSETVFFNDTGLRFRNGERGGSRGSVRFF